MRRKTLGLTLALMMAGGVPAFAAPATPVEWQPCGPAECTTVGAPLDHAHPDGERISIAVARKKATDPARRIGTLVVLPSFALQSGRDLVSGFSPELSARFDVVGFDPRGAGGSTQVRCGAEVLDRWPGDFPDDAAAFDKVKAYNKNVYDDCKARTGEFYDHVSSAALAGDIELVRAALGEDKISLFATRQTTIAAEGYANQHPDRVRALVLDSPLDSAQDARSFMENAARVTDRTFSAWVAWNARTPASPLYGKDVDKLWAEKLAAAKKPAELGLTASAYLQDPSNWGALSRLVAGAPATAADDEEWDYSFPAYFCADYGFRTNTFDEYQALAAAETELSPRTFGSLFGQLGWQQCAGMPASSSAAVPAAPRALVTVGRYDETAPLEAVVARYPGAVVYEGYGSEVYGRSACTIALNDRFLIDLVRPAPGTTCAAVEPTM